MQPAALGWEYQGRCYDLPSRFARGVSDYRLMQRIPKPRYPETPELGQQARGCSGSRLASNMHAGVIPSFEVAQ